jgi:hypothetical protein
MHRAPTPTVEKEIAMSLQKQINRGLFALPVAALLILAGVRTPADAALPASDCATARVEADAVRRVDFHSMLPGALHVSPRKIKVVSPISEG